MAVKFARWKMPRSRQANAKGSASSVSLASAPAEALNLLSRLRDTPGLTFLMASHDLAVIDHICDRILVTQNGKAVAQLTRETLTNAQMKPTTSAACLLPPPTGRCRVEPPHSIAHKDPTGASIGAPSFREPMGAGGMKPPNRRQN